MPKSIPALFVNNKDIVAVGVLLGWKNLYFLNATVEGMFGVVSYSIGCQLIEFEGIIVGHAE